jgi:hypothetical protein
LTAAGHLDPAIIRDERRKPFEILCGASFDGLLSLASISNSLIGVDSFYGVRSLLRSGDKSLEMNWVVEPTTQTTKGDWDAMFAQESAAP